MQVKSCLGGLVSQHRKMRTLVVEVRKAGEHVQLYVILPLAVVLFFERRMLRANFVHQ